LERALSFVIDSKADNKAKLFMWKLQQLKVEQKKSISYEALDHQAINFFPFYFGCNFCL
jgi:hypothetical protein